MHWAIMTPERQNADERNKVRDEGDLEPETRHN